MASRIQGWRTLRFAPSVQGPVRDGLYTARFPLDGPARLGRGDLEHRADDKGVTVLSIAARITLSLSPSLLAAGKIMHSYGWWLG